ncbi:SPFH domain-containing protein [Anaerosacchariphilus polymeriproducens]|uniref:SPFH domain-containing protein n=1 Tax=Anaerosacchariphilus polymeriproducens TaxID=1812858 RepID=A0A371AV31_9FIRM|nr:SPFH domain-containing protein [Anaerosacchariphilus polymeriproducens]RDU23426.1 SPFH domain-containing protein [Anaerosacchariphilus polymeriproducens]
MGLIRAMKNAVGSVTADQWREYFYCDSIDSDILVTKGQKRTAEKRRSSNTKAEDNIISNGSIVAVNEGQCMIIVDQGKIVEVCAEAGEFVYDTSTEASLFYGDLSSNISKTFSNIGKRFTFGGDTAKDQRIYFFNTKEIMGNKYGTANPVPFRVVDTNIGLDIDIAIRCFGEYSYKIVDPLLFYSNVSGNVTEEYSRTEIDDQLKSELMTVLQPAFAKISAMGIRYSSLPGHTIEISEALKELLSAKWTELRGIEISSFGINGVKASEEDEALIKEMQKNAVLRNPGMAAATLVGAQSEAMKAAASNTSTGPMMAFAGMNMAANAGGMNANTLFNMAQDQQATSPLTNSNAVNDTTQSTPENSWTCSCGKTGNTGKFCTECGQSKPADNLGWTCSCGAVNKGNFCQECGAKRPVGAPLYRCDKCGWEPADPKNPPKFCPECGDIFNDEDIKK